ncbi:hypothetical protein ACFWM1_21550 [Nocardia sp. NPDC058379]|uniref:hypothetical protein n=1 Tax=unclassified Nocardia TaxID=2637762 RepID=UPI0036664B9C
MAIYLVVRRASETEETVTYRFGGAEHRFERELTIGKTDYSVVFADGQEDHLGVLAAGLVISRHRAEGVWARFVSRQS